MGNTTVAPGSKAVVITHGWNSSASTWVQEMAKAICAKLGFNDPFKKVNSNDLTPMCQVNKDNNLWDVWVYDWQTDAEVSSLLHVTGEDSYKSPKDILPFAMQHGDALATKLREKNYQHIHFIAHSARAKLIDTATAYLKIDIPPPIIKIHETFLDAYDPWKEASSYGYLADWADNYVDTRSVDLFDGTKLFLKEAYNVDVTPAWYCGFRLNLVEEIKCRHSRPYRFYGLSVSTDLADTVEYKEYQGVDPIGPTVGMGYPLSVKEGRSVDDTDLKHLFPKGKTCGVSGTSCVPNYHPIPSYVDYRAAQNAEASAAKVIGAIEYIVGTGAYLYDSIKMGLAWVTNSALQRTLAAAEQVTVNGAAVTEEPSYLTVNVTTTTPVNTLRFNWSFDTAGEGLLRVFVNGHLVRQIDQRHVTPSSLVTEKIFIGDDAGPLPPGTHRITFNLDGFGASASGVELTAVEVGLTGPLLAITKAGTGTGTVTSSPAGINCGATCSAPLPSARPSASPQPPRRARPLPAGLATPTVRTEASSRMPTRPVRRASAADLTLR